MSDNEDQSSAVNEQKVIGEQVKDAPQTTADKQQQQAIEDFSGNDTDGLSMEVRVYSPFRDYYDGPAFSVTAENATGVFDILPQHHNFISLLSPCDLVIRSVDQGEQRIRISGGLLHVKADSVIVFLDV